MQRFAARQVRLGVAPIAWTNADIPEMGGDTPVEECLRESREAGFSATEISNNFPQQATEMVKILTSTDLELASGWHCGQLAAISVAEEKKLIDPWIDYYLECGSAIMFYGETSNAIQAKVVPLSQKPCLSPEQMQSYCAKISELAEYCATRGIKLAYHPHMGAVIQTEAEVDQLMTNTSDALGLLVDSGHLMFAGSDGCTIAERYANRVSYVHCKDVRAELLAQTKQEDWDFMTGVRKGVFTVPGDGCIDFDAFIGSLAKIGYAGWLIVEAEQDPKLANPKQYSQMGREHLEPLLAKHNFELLPAGRS